MTRQLEQQNDRKAAAELIDYILRVKRPRYVEPEEYTNPPYALTVLRKVAGITRQEMAFKLGIGASQLEKAESGFPGGSLQIDQIERCVIMSQDFCLPQLEKFFRMLHTITRKQRKRGPKSSAGKAWYDADLNNG